MTSPTGPGTSSPGTGKPIFIRDVRSIVRAAFHKARAGSGDLLRQSRFVSVRLPRFASVCREVLSRVPATPLANHAKDIREERGFAKSQQQRRSSPPAE